MNVSIASELFLQCKKHYISYIRVGNQVGGFAVSKDGDGIGDVGFRARDGDGACSALGTVTLERSCGVEGTRAETDVGEDLLELCGLRKLIVAGYFLKIPYAPQQSADMSQVCVAPFSPI